MSNTTTEEMTQEEKTTRIEKLIKRIKRFRDWVEYYKPDDLFRLVSLQLKYRVMQEELYALASQPTVFFDLKAMNYYGFDNGGINTTTE